MNYKDSGVDIEKGDEFAKGIGKLAASTFNKSVLNGIGSFSSQFALDLSEFPNPVLVSGTDGVGTKLKYAFLLNKHTTIGIDLVAMCVNDILTCGATPLFFLDYLATGKLELGVANDIVKGIVRGCTLAGCSLVGGETAEMPGFYQEGEYDLAGFAVGAVDKKKIIDGSSIKVGDVVLGISSTGIHSNGYSLIRKLFDGYDLSTTYKEIENRILGDVLLKPTRIYVPHIKLLKQSNIKIKGMAHITGGGLVGNIPRILPSNMSVKMEMYSTTSLFQWIQDLSGMSYEEMCSTFNMGIGFIIVVSERQAMSAYHLLSATGCCINRVGVVVSGKQEVIL